MNETTGEAVEVSVKRSRSAPSAPPTFYDITRTESNAPSVAKSGAYDMTEISTSSSGGPRLSIVEDSEAQQSILSDVPTQTSYRSRGSSLSEHDRELRSFPMAITSRVFFFIGCAMFLWLAVDDLFWAEDAQSIPATVLEADDDLTWRQFRNAQSDRSGNAGSGGGGSISVITKPRTEAPTYIGLGLSEYVRQNSNLGEDDDSEDEISWSQMQEIFNVGDDGKRRRLNLRRSTSGGTQKKDALQSRRAEDDGAFGFHTPWSDLSFSKQIAASTLGHDERTWNTGLPTFADLIQWSDLTPEQQEAATELGYSQYLWDMLRGFVAPRTSAPSSEASAAAVSSTREAWADLSFTKQIAAATLGYDETIWNSGGTTFTDTLSWDALTFEQRDAALSLGYNQYLWDMLRGFTPPRTASPSANNGSTSPTSAPTRTPNWGAMFWAELPDEIQAAALTLDYNETVWNNGERTAVDDLFWNQLTVEQQEAATLLGYSQGTWDVYADMGPLPTTTPLLQDVWSPAPTPIPTSAPTPMSTPGTTSETTSESTSAVRAPETVSPATWRSYLWSDLPDNIRGGAIALGFTEELWNDGAKVATDQYFWDELSAAQQQAATEIFGYTKVTWNSSYNKWQKIAWNQLPSDIQEHAAVLGFDEKLWDSGADIDTETYRWDELSGEQQQAAFTIFGLTEESWAMASIRNESAQSANVKNGGGGRGGGRGGADDDYVFSVEKGNDDVWVSKYQIVYFIGSICFAVVGILDLIREGRPFHILMIIAGCFSILAAMWVETNLTTSNIFHCFSMHFFVFEGLTRFFYRPQLRALVPGPCKNALWMADICFVCGATMEAILSYFYFSKDDARENLHIARADSFAALLFFMSAAIWLAITPVVFFRNTRHKPYRP